MSLPPVMRKTYIEELSIVRFKNRSKFAQQGAYIAIELVSEVLSGNLMRDALVVESTPRESNHKKRIAKANTNIQALLVVNNDEFLGPSSWVGNIELNSKKHNSNKHKNAKHVIDPYINRRLRHVNVQT